MGHPAAIRFAGIIPPPIFRYFDKGGNLGNWDTRNYVNRADRQPTLMVCQAVLKHQWSYSAQPGSWWARRLGPIFVVGSTTAGFGPGCSAGHPDRSSPAGRP